MQEGTVQESIIENTEQSTPAASKSSFAGILANSDVVDALTEMGVKEPWPLEKAIIEGCASNDNVVVSGEKGSGKTTGVAVVVRDQASPKTAPGSVLVVVGTIAKARETADMMERLGLEVTILDETEKPGKPATPVLLGVPGAILEYTKEHTAALKSISLVVLDEVDNLLSASASEAVNDILAATKKAAAKARYIFVSDSSSSGETLQEFTSRHEIDCAKILQSETEDAGACSHLYYEITGDLLAKPNTLGDILEAEKLPKTLIFCNEPSETDLVHAMLQKRGIGTDKLIGNVPHSRITKAITALQSGEICSIVTTDIAAARGIDVDHFEVVVNYSVHSDPEVYLHRSAKSSPSSALRRIITLVSPVDFGNFHYVKKVVEHEFAQMDPPDAHAIAENRLGSLEKQAQQAELKDESLLQELTAGILESDKKERVISFLLHNTLHELPAARSESGGRGKGRRRGGYDDDQNAREDDGRRDNRRGDRRHSGNRRGRNDDDRGSEGRDRRQKRQSVPKIRDSRYYIGHGEANGLSADEFRKLVAKSDGVTDEDIKRITIRGTYGFVDFPEERAEEIAEILSDVELDDGTALFLEKATTILTPVEQPEESEQDDSEEPDTEDSEDAFDDEEEE